MADSNFALIITESHALQKITTAGPGAVLTPPGAVSDVSVASNANIWIVTEDPDAGGSTMMFSPDNGKTFKLPSGKKVGGAKVAATPDGHCWFIAADGSVNTVNFAGDVAQILPAESAEQIAIDASGRVWIISSQVNEHLGGNIVMETTIAAKSFKPIAGNPVASKISAWQDGSCWVVTPKGEVGFIELSGTTGLLSPPGQNIALDIGISPNGGTTWIVGTEEDDQHGTYGNVIRYWDERGTKSQDWKVVPGVQGIAVSGAG